MFWIFNILINKRLRAREIVLRAKFIKENEAFITELYSLKEKMSKFDYELIKTDFYALVLRETKLNKLIENLKLMSLIANMLLTSRNRVNKFENYLKKTKKFIDDTSSKSKLLKGFDGFGSSGVNHKLKTLAPELLNKLSIETFQKARAI